MGHILMSEKTHPAMLRMAPLSAVQRGGHAACCVGGELKTRDNLYWHDPSHFCDIM